MPSKYGETLKPYLAPSPTVPDRLCHHVNFSASSHIHILSAAPKILCKNTFPNPHMPDFIPPMSLSTAKKALLATIIPVLFCCYAIGKWFIIRNRRASRSSAIHRSTHEEIQRCVSGPRSITPIIFRRTTLLTDEENGIPLVNIPSVARPSAVIVRRESYSIPPTPTIVPPSPPHSIFGTSISSETLVASSEHSNIWGNSIPPSMAYHEFAPLTSTSQISSQQSNSTLDIYLDVADDMSLRFLIE